MPLEDVRVLYFDVFGTVVDWLSSVSSQCRATVESSPCLASAEHQSALLEYDWDEFTRQWRRGYMVTTRELSLNGNPDKITVDQMHLTILNRLLSELPSPASAGAKPLDRRQLAELSAALSEAWDLSTREKLNSVWHRLAPWPDSPAALSSLKEHVSIGTLTNGNLSLMVEMARHGSLPWDFILTADLLGSFKPDPKMYGRALELMHLSTTKSAGAMVAAHLYDLEAAKQSGMTTVFVSDRPTEDALPAEGKPDYVDIVVANLGELAELLRQSRDGR